MTKIMHDTPAQEAFLSADEAAPQNFDARTYTKTITMRTIGASPTRCLTDPRSGAPSPHTHILCRIWGMVRGIEFTSPTADAVKPAGERTELKMLAGEFEAEVYDNDGIVTGYYGGLCALPGGFQEIVLSRLQEQVEAGAETPSYGFNFLFASRPSTAPAGYSYVARNLDEQRTDPVSYLSRARTRGDEVMTHIGVRASLFLAPPIGGDPL